MKKLLLWIAALAVCPLSALMAQNISGTWQGSLALPGRPPLRIVLKVSRADDEKLKAVMYSIDQPGPGIPASAVSLQGSTFKVTVAAIGGNYEGKLGGDTITGTWTQGPAPMPLNLTRATDATAWSIPDPPPPPKMMAPDAKPVFDVATIKPSQPNTPDSIQIGRAGGNTLTTTHSSLYDLITFAYRLHAKQVTGGPSWMESERYDITAKPDLAGLPSIIQAQAMMQKLLTDRFGLTFHREKKELSAYTITVAKTGVKMEKSQPGAILPGFGGRGPGNIGVRNSTMGDFAQFLQSRILDRPVVDQTSLPERYDFQLKWTPDGAPQPATPDPDAPPDLFTAFQQQLGLKLEATKAPVDVIVVDKVEKPSEN